jgi:hypothetical protein
MSKEIAIVATFVIYIYISRGLAEFEFMELDSPGINLRKCQFMPINSRGATSSCE